MTDKQIQMLTDLAKARIAELQAMTPEEARASSLASLNRAGILDLDGNYTDPYKELERWTKKQ